MDNIFVGFYLDLSPPTFLPFLNRLLAPELPSRAPNQSSSVIHNISSFSGTTRTLTHLKY